MLISALAEVDECSPGGAADPQPDAAGAAVKLFGDPLRAQIVRLLAREQMCTCHLVHDTGARQSTVSHHLRILREAGFIAAEPRGRYTYYKLRPEALSALTAGIAELTVQAHRAQAARRPCS
jgi:ArsR family transcriptional regulator